MRGKRSELAAWIERVQPSQIGDAEWEILRQHLAPISESYLRKLLRNAGLPLTPLVEGVRQETLESLELSLLRLLEEYEHGRQTRARQLVILAKDHARWSKREEVLLWTLTWLENPPLFPAWARLRRARIESIRAPEASRS